MNKTFKLKPISLLPYKPVRKFLGACADFISRRVFAPLVYIRVRNNKRDICGHVLPLDYPLISLLIFYYFVEYRISVDTTTIAIGTNGVIVATATTAATVTTAIGTTVATAATVGQTSILQCPFIQFLAR
jgi:prepilin signal peptidase PulO-like enzyme (type II secretory pathway)